MFPALFRKQEAPPYVRERIHTPDGDFLDLDWCKEGNQRLVILSHGYEGHSYTWYMRGMVHALRQAGWDTLAWNFRGCSGEPPVLPRIYEAGATDDLDQVVRHAVSQGYKRISLLGFSLGGNLSLLYLGRMAHEIPEQVIASITFSVPTRLSDAAIHMNHWSNRYYLKRFLRSLFDKIEAMAHVFPNQVDLSYLPKIKSLQDFDRYYTAPMNGYASAEEYWVECSSRSWIPSIRVPSLIVNAMDDPFLPKTCFPIREAAGNEKVMLDMPRRGGHLGFVRLNGDEQYWSEKRAIGFIDSQYQHSDP